LRTPGGGGSGPSSAAWGEKGYVGQTSEKNETLKGKGGGASLGRQGGWKQLPDIVCATVADGVKLFGQGLTGHPGMEKHTAKKEGKRDDTEATEDKTARNVKKTSRQLHPK